MRDRLFVLMQHLLPQHGLSRLVYRLTRIRAGWFKDGLIRGFLRLFDVDTEECVGRPPEDFASFNEFFTRALRDGARSFPEAADALISPVDGTLSQAGRVSQTTLLQAKGHRYGVADLLGDPGTASLFEGGAYATIYLAPYNYHRIHMPVDGRLQLMRYVPGRLFSVNEATVAALPRLFARNERVVCQFETEAGPLALVMVGALNVGSIETVWAGEVTPTHASEARSWHYEPGQVALARGDEVGRFNMGSTVIVVGVAGGLSLDPGLGPGDVMRMGRQIGTIRTRQAGNA